MYRAAAALRNCILLAHALSQCRLGLAVEVEGMGAVRPPPPGHQQPLWGAPLPPVRALLGASPFFLKEQLDYLTDAQPEREEKWTSESGTALYDI